MSNALDPAEYHSPPVRGLQTQGNISMLFSSLKMELTNTMPGYWLSLYECMSIHSLATRLVNKGSQCNTVLYARQ